MIENIRADRIKIHLLPVTQDRCAELAVAVKITGSKIIDIFIIENVFAVDFFDGIAGFKSFIFFDVFGFLRV